MKSCKQKPLVRRQLSAQVFIALALMAAGTAQADVLEIAAAGVPAAGAPVAGETQGTDAAGNSAATAADSGTALDAIAIKDKVVINGSNVVTRAPVQASLKASTPQSIITATFIEQAVSPLADFNAVARIAPSIGNGVSANGPGLGETKVTLRGFQDGEYNMTYDGIPFGDTNNPTHHSTSYFPARIIGGMVIERGPGTASNLGQATFGGSINLFSKELSQDFRFTPYSSFGSWNTAMGGVEIDTGLLPAYGDANLMFNASRLKSDGYQSYSGVTEDNLQLKFQRPLGKDTTLTIFSTYNKIHSYVPDKAGVTLSQVAQFGKNYSLNNDRTSQNYYGYNYNDKTTDFEYIRLQSKLAEGWNVDNTLYTYFYNNDTFSGQDASGATANGTKAAPAGNKDVPGYNKLNSYRVNGDIVKLTGKFDAGLLRAGLWLERANTNRHTYDIDWTLGTQNPKESTAPKDIAYEQYSSWKQYQPFVEFEWAVAPSVTITPGVKYVSFKRSLNAPVNQTTRIATATEQTYSTTLPFLSANYRISDSSSAYLQTAKGFLVPDLSMFYVNTPSLSSPKPQTSTNYQVGAVHQSQDLTLDGDIYYIDFNNKIASTGTGNDLVYYNQGGVVYKGVEAAVTYYIGNGFSVHANGSKNSAKAKDTGLQIAKAPDSTSALGLLYKAGALYGSLIAKNTGSQYAKDGEPAAYKIDGYTTADANVGYRWKNLSRYFQNVRLQVGVSNLFNKQDAVQISANSKGAAFDQYTFQPERSWNLSLSADL